MDNVLFSTHQFNLIDAQCQVNVLDARRVSASRHGLGWTWRFTLVPHWKWTNVVCCKVSLNTDKQQSHKKTLAIWQCDTRKHTNGLSKRFRICLLVGIKYSNHRWLARIGHARHSTVHGKMSTTNDTTNATISLDSIGSICLFSPTSHTVTTVLARLTC